MEYINITDYPELKLILWEFHIDRLEYNKTLLDYYERRWRYIHEDKLTTKESLLIQRLVKDFGNDVFMPS